jgi:hypothetical protein
VGGSGSFDGLSTAWDSLAVDVEAVLGNSHATLIVVSRSGPGVLQTTVDAIERWCAAAGIEIDQREAVTRFAQQVATTQSANNPPLRQRPDGFVHAVLDARKAWGLYDQRWARSTAGPGEAIPFWPSRESAAACCLDAWAEYRPRAIDLDELVEAWLTGMVEDEIAAVLWPGPADDGVVISPTTLLSRLADARET